MSDLIKLYNPANAAALTPQQVAGLQDLTSAEIKELAAAYPNLSMQRAYLLIIDKTKPIEKQLPALSSYENLWNLREKNGLRNFVAFGFKGVYKAIPQKPKRTEVLDLSETELLSLPGFKTAGKSNDLKPVEINHPPEEVKVTKVKKVVAKQKT